MDQNVMMTIKVVIVGDNAVVKSCLLISATRNYFSERNAPPVFWSFSVNIIHNNKLINFQISKFVMLQVKKNIIEFIPVQGIVKIINNEQIDLNRKLKFQDKNKNVERFVPQ
jgi:GTPase SAR1 family protein